MSTHEGLGLGDFDYSSRGLDESALRAAVDEEPFAEEAFEILKELGQSTTLVAGLHRLDDEGAPRCLTRDEAVLAGPMVRAVKLQHGLLQASAPERMGS